MIAKAPNRELKPADANDQHFVRNGSTGVITAIGDDHLVVDFYSLGPVPVPAKWFEKPKSLDLAYAQASYAIQGATNDVSTSVITRGVGASELLVNLTRGREQNMVFAVGDNDTEFSGDTPDDIAAAIGESVRVTQTTTIADLDPTAATCATAPAQTLTHLDPHSDAATVAGARNQRHVAHEITAQFGTLPTDITEALGPKPDSTLWIERRAIIELHWLGLTQIALHIGRLTLTQRRQALASAAPTLNVKELLELMLLHRRTVIQRLVDHRP